MEETTGFFDHAAIVSMIEGVSPSIVAVGTAVLGVVFTIKTIRWIRSAG